MNIKRETHDYIKIREESDLSLEVVILLILGVFMFLFGLLLFKISTGELPYTPDSTYGLFLVIVSFQVITMGKTPFGDLRRSLVLVLIGIITALVGMVACFKQDLNSDLPFKFQKLWHKTFDSQVIAIYWNQISNLLAVGYNYLFLSCIYFG